MPAREKSLGHLISILYRSGRSFLDRELRPYGLGSGQFIFLIALLHQDGISQDTLALLLNIDKGTTARAISKLESAGYVRRIPDTDDRRSNIVYLTPNGKELQGVITDISKRWTSKLTRDLTPAETETAIHLLSRMAENALLE